MELKQEKNTNRLGGHTIHLQCLLYKLCVSFIRLCMTLYICTCTCACMYGRSLIASSRGPNGGSSALPRPSSCTAAPRRTAPGPSNLCPSYLTTFITIHSSYGCLVKKKYVRDRCNELERTANHFLGPTDHF